MLLRCPECGNPFVSETAETCPRCGFKLDDVAKQDMRQGVRRSEARSRTRLWILATALLLMPLFCWVKHATHEYEGHYAPVLIPAEHGGGFAGYDRFITPAEEKESVVALVIASTIVFGLAGGGIVVYLQIKGQGSGSS